LRASTPKPQSNGIPVEELFRCLGNDFERRLFAVLETYIDESGDAPSHLFTLACIVSHGGQFWWFEQAWKKCLEKKNAELKQQGRKQLSRYKTADCSWLKNEFVDWNKDEQIAFFESLLNVFRYHETAIFSYTCDLRHIEQEFPEATEPKQAKALAYILLLQHLMQIIGERILDDKRYIRERISIVHDRTTEHDSILLDAFNGVIQDKHFKYGRRFTTIAPMGWEDCILLQPADLIAYENFKLVERQRANQPRRKAVEAILDLDSIGGRGAELKLEAFQQIKSGLTTETKNSLYRNARINLTR
jgi:hypothetical protein